MLRSTLALIAVATLCYSGLAAAQQKQRAQFDGMTAHVFLENSGRFSGPIGRVANFSTWNFNVSGKGIPAGERFHAVLLRIRLKARGEVFAAGTQAVVIVRERGGRRRWRFDLKDLYVPRSGQVYQALLVRDIGCLPLHISASSHGKIYKRVLNFRCGE